MLARKDAWTLRELSKLRKYKFNLEYLEMIVWRILICWNMHHAKPYILEKRRPDDAETIFKKINFQEGDLLGSLDKSSQNINSNTKKAKVVYGTQYCGSQS